MENISLEPQEAPKEYISLETEDTLRGVNPDVAASRALKYSMAIPSFGKTYGEIYEDLIGGREKYLQSEAAVHEDQQRRLHTERVISAVAARKGGPLTLEEQNFIREAAKEYSTETDPESVFQLAYGKEYMRYLDLAFPGQSNTVQEEIQKGEKPVLALRDAAREVVAWREFALRGAEDAQQAIDEQSWLGWGADQLKQVVPFYNEAKMRGLVAGSGLLEGGLLGSNLEAQAQRLLKLPLKERMAEYTRIMDQLKQDNPSLAAQFAQAVLGQTTSEIFINNAFTAIDLAGWGGVAKGITKAFTKKAFQDVAASAGTPNASPSTILEAAGDLGSAAVVKAKEKLTAEAVGKADPIKDVIEDLPSAIRGQVTDVEGKMGSKSREAFIRIRDAYTRFSEGLMDALQNKLNVNRLSVLEGTEAFLKEAKDHAKELYPNISNQIIDFENVLYDHISNTYSLDVRLGNKGAEYFTDSETAFYHARKMGLNDYKIEQQGLGFYIKINKPVDETRSFFQNTLLNNKEFKAPETMLNQWLAWIRTPDEVLSPDQIKNRKAATYGPSRFQKILEEEAKYIKDLAKGVISRDPVTGKVLSRQYFGRKKRFEEWERIINAARTKPDPKTGDLGYFYNNVAELEDDYLRYIGRRPDDIEVEAYFAYKRIHELDWVLRNNALYRAKRRLGGETHEIFFKSSDGKTVIGSKPFDGVFRKDLAGNEDTILVIGKKEGTHALYDSKRMTARVKKDLEKDIKEGRKVIIEVLDPEQRTFRDILKSSGEPDARVRYVVAETVETKALSWQQIPKRGGGHWEYDYQFYIKQARVNKEKIGTKLRHWYEGDTTIMPITIRKMGQDVAQKLDEIRKLLKAEDIEGAKEFARNAKLGIEWDEIHSWFKPKMIGGIRQPARLSLREPIMVVERGKTIADLDKGPGGLVTRYSDFKDGTRQGSLMRQFSVEYTQERDSDIMKTLLDEGSKNNPLYKYETAKMVDPIETMNRALSRIINSTFMDDYKVNSVESWIRAAEKVLDVDPGELRTAPFYHFSNPKYNKNADPLEVNRLQAMRFQIRQFTGIKSKFDTMLEAAGQKLADSLYGKFGPKHFVVKSADALGTLKDPITFIRSITFNAKLGFWSIPQLIVQAQTYTNIMGVAGWKHTTAGTAAAMMTQYARINRNPEIIKGMDRMLSKLHVPGTTRWKPGEFEEAWKALQDSGFERVAGEYASLDEPFKANIIASKGRNFLNAGQIFFREGERNVRYGAWFTAYKEFRAKNPIGRLTNENKKEILNRADLLSVNMSRASSSALHSGLLSIPTQFLTYQLRLAELMWGKRLTGIEKARVLAWNASLYGVPTAMGVTAYPFGDILRQAALENGYVAGNNWIESLATEGMPATLLALATGEWYNIPERWGAGGFEALRADETFWDVVGGATLSTALNTWKNLDGFMTAMMSAMADDGKAFPFRWEDLADIPNEISSYSAGRKALVALHTGRLLSRKEVYLDNVTGAEAIMGFLTGLSPQGVSDLNLQSWSRKDQEENEKAGLEAFVKEFRRGLRAQESTPEAARAYFTRAFTKLRAYGYPEHKISSAIALASKDHESLVDRMNWDFYIKQAPDDKRETRMKAFIDMKQRNTQ